uniref:Uncharacterized protein n=1 Tax=Anguilla anguilla TaxID=7936 RepID=A0A0E9PCK5_ANGAN
MWLLLRPFPLITCKTNKNSPRHGTDSWKQQAVYRVFKNS